MRYLIALGSSIGQRQSNIEQGFRLISNLGTLEAVSKILETEPTGGIAKNKFFNAAVILRTETDPQTLMQELLKVEALIGRVRGNKWEDRLIDLDIILDDSQSILDTPSLKLPHPLAHERWFVLKPASEIAPDWIHPLSHRTIIDLLTEMESTQ